MFNNKAVVLSILLSAANITGSSGLMIWVDTMLKDGGMILDAYIPVFSYLLGLSLGCMTISFLIRKMNINFFEKNIFGLFLLLATTNCILFAREITLIPVWLDALHRILWGVISGFIVIMGRNILIPVIFQVASLLAALTHPGHIVIYAPGDSLPCRRDAS
ncbi:hypothetical protein OO184_07590 [Photorhabdus sp. APURE]|uniref:hypothetical protein n=1 Tax=Photorhabdus aballayi TaxID=2991723 RepID=UPI00223DCE6A|nr:hypothetical protein [Photorhabdus aballayi]MCW7547801.1 hypothetical protein [Photorhabdus aballayi]